MKTLDRTVVNLIARRCLLEPPQNRHGLSESRQPTPTRKRDLLAYCTFSIVVIKPDCASLTTSLRQVGGEGRPQGGTHDSCCGAGAVKTRKPCWCERRDPRAPIPPGSNPDPKSTNSRKSLLRNVFVCRADFSVVASQVASHKPPICFLSLSLCTSTVPEPLGTECMSVVCILVEDLQQVRQDSGQTQPSPRPHRGSDVAVDAMGPGKPVRPEKCWCDRGRLAGPTRIRTFLA